MSDIDPWLAALAASQQAQRGAFNPKAKYPAETDKFLSEQEQFYGSIGFDPLDYAAPAQQNVQQFVNESGLPTVTVNGETAWIGESSARAFYEGAPEDDEYAALALDAMDMIDNGASPLEARRWASEQIAAAQTSNPQAFTDLDLADKIVGDVDRYGADLNTRQSTVDRAVATKGQAADDYGMFQGGGQYTSGLGEDPFGYERGQAQGSLADYQGIDQEQVRKLLQGNLNKDMGEAKLAAGQSFGYDTDNGRAVGGASLRPQAEPSNPLVSKILDSIGQNPKPRRSQLDANMDASRANVAAIAGPSDQDVRVAGAVQAGQNLYSDDEFVRGAARQGYANRQQDLRAGPNQGHQELIRRVVAERVRRGLEPIPSRPGPIRTGPSYNPTSHGGRPKKVEKKG